jgi:cation:H+ antiporter
VTDVIQLFGGLIYLLMGGDLLVRGAVALARRARVPPLIVALSVVAFGTSLPELVVTLRAVFADYHGIALGNVVGSNIANVLLVIGAPAIVYPLTCCQGSERRDATIMLLISLGFYVLCISGDLDRLAGIVLLAGLGLLMLHGARVTTRLQAENHVPTPLDGVVGLPTRKRLIVLFLVLGAIGLPVGAELTVDAAASLADRIAVSDTVVGLSIVAVGTSLPELATALVAAIRKHTDVAIGTVIGSNAFNLLAITGTAAIVSSSPIPVPRSLLTFDLPVMLATAAFLTLAVWRRATIGRAAGIVLVTAYAAYLVALYI